MEAVAETVLEALLVSLSPIALLVALWISSLSLDLFAIALLAIFSLAACFIITMPPFTCLFFKTLFG
jgi:uncharacterized membrane protein